VTDASQSYPIPAPNLQSTSVPAGRDLTIRRGDNADFAISEVDKRVQTALRTAADALKTQATNVQLSDLQAYAPKDAQDSLSAAVQALTDTTLPVAIKDAYDELSAQVRTVFDATD
jgi:hypothetical protein